MGEKKVHVNSKAARLGTIITLVVIIVAILVFGSFYDVSEQEQAVVTMFGKVQDVKSAGLYFKLPLVQHVTKVDTTTKGMQIGYTSAMENSYDDAPSVEYEALMITSDFNFVDIDFYLEYRVSDPQKYLYTSSDPITALQNLAQADIRATVINYTVDDVITTGKSQIQAEVKDKLTKDLVSADLGLEVVNLSVQDAEPPTSEVMKAFKAVETAKQSADTAINNANQYQNEQLPAAEASADKITQEAEAQKEIRIAEAVGEVAKFNAMYEEYKLNPEITKKRMFYETMEDVLPGLKVIIDDGGTQTLLPLDSMVNVNGSTSTVEKEDN